MEARTDEWLKFWNENQKSLFQAWKEGKLTHCAMHGEQRPGTEVMGYLMKRSMEDWGAVAKDAWSTRGKFAPAAMQRLLDPAEWKRAGSHFDMGLEKLTEGPTYATLWDLDKKMLNTQKLWVERARDVEQYWEVMQGAWSRAFERFMKHVNDPKAEPIKSGRAMLDLWLATANGALLEMHRSKEFLEAQRRMTRSSTEYRLAEREIAEAFCEMHHIPTRTERDEIQKARTQLRRELRAMNKQGTRHEARPAPAARAKRGRK